MVGKIRMYFILGSNSIENCKRVDVEILILPVLFYWFICFGIS